jgi:hypothetical protein
MDIIVYVSAKNLWKTSTFLVPWYCLFFFILSESTMYDTWSVVNELQGQLCLVYQSFGTWMMYFIAFPWWLDDVLYCLFSFSNYLILFGIIYDFCQLLSLLAVYLMTTYRSIISLVHFIGWDKGCCCFPQDKHYYSRSVRSDDKRNHPNCTFLVLIYFLFSLCVKTWIILYHVQTKYL